jgi:N-acetylmuramoyl-L-alanine amidase CwlA
MELNTRILGDFRVDPDSFIGWLTKTYFEPDPETQTYIRSVPSYTRIVGMRDDVPLAQWMQETSEDDDGDGVYIPGTSELWDKWRNPAGMGAPNPGGVRGNPNAAKFIGQPDKAAKAQVGHLLVYALGPSRAAELWRAKGLGDLSKDDPRFDAYLDEYGDVARATTIADLSKSWAVDPEYAIGIVSNARKAGFVSSSNGGTGMSIDVQVDRNIATNRVFPALIQKDAVVTVHMTGNNAPRSSERQFVKDGGGAQGVAYHFAVDETGITQIMPLWMQGIHAGNVTGNKTSIAFEITENREPFSALVDNASKLLAMLYTRDQRLDWSGAEAFKFSDKRTVAHRNWEGANPGCPGRLISAYGVAEVETLIDKALGYASGVKPVPVVIKPSPIGGETKRNGKTKNVGGTTWTWVAQDVIAGSDIQCYQYANTASAKGPVIKKGDKFVVYYVVGAEDAAGKFFVWGTTKLGWRFRLDKVVFA